MSFLSPAAWNGVGVVSIILVVATATAIALVKGWIVLGVTHRELISIRDRELEAAERRDVENQKSIAKFADAAAVSTATAEVQQAMVTAMRQIAEEHAP
ncbi:hypothetical protein [Gordonia soli]|uniref:Uncharacterized protein n=1 Tax=Gordonia soli NBRC 108243 TaxID=1223545 RepID=M0QQP0_9ACTN|nr:hypothetical protein [Gordonia soli]GAC70714.1 hypothetical protein GS4_39_00450 [Gordonia soli NBRC 108243]